MDDAWELSNNLNPSDPKDAWCDYDNDRIINLFEYQLQTNPNDFASPPIRYFTPQNTQEEFTELMNSGLNDLAVIRMSAGTYNLSYNSNSSGNLITSANYNIMIQGGWNIDFTEYNPFTNPTIFDGQGNENILKLTTEADQQVTFILEGVEVTNSGNGDKQAAIECRDLAGTGKFSFYNCSFYNNGYGNNSPTNTGAALAIIWPDEIINGGFFLINSSIVNNRNGLYGQVSSTSSGRWRIYNSTITNSTQNNLLAIEGSSQSPNALTIDLLNSIIWESDIDMPINFSAAENTEVNIAYSNISEINNDDNLLKLNILPATVTNIVPEFINETESHFELQAQSPLKEAGYITGLPFEGNLPDIGVNKVVYSQLKVDTIVTQPTCLGNDGRIEIVPLNGIDDLSISLDDVDYQTDFIFNMLDVGNYTLYIKRDKTCQKMQLPFLLEEVAQQTRKEAATFCSNENYTLPDDVIVTAPGVYNSTVTNYENCTVNIETTLSQTTAYETVDEVSICEGETYTLIDGREFSRSGTFTTNLKSVENCDSVFVVNLTVNESPVIEKFISYCEFAGATYMLEDGTVVTNSGTYTVEIINNITGCTETYITEINFTNQLETTQEASICEGEAYTLPDGREVTAEDVYESTFQSVQGCDSVVFTNLSYIITEELISEEINICDGETHTLPDGRVVSEQNTYTSEVVSPFGCTKIYTTRLKVNIVDIINTWIFICKGESYELPDGRIVQEEGTYNNYFTSIFNCDSTINIYLIHNTPTEEKEVSICEGETYSLDDGRTVAEANTYTFELADEITGCITTYHTILNVNEVYRTSQNAIVCNDVSYTLPNGAVVNETGVYESLLQSMEGCDSLVTTNLSINSTQVIQEEISICSGNTYTLADGRIISEAGIYSFDLVDPTTSCSAPYSITISVENIYETNQEVAVCEGETYMLPDGREVSEENIYESILQSTQNCDSIIVTNLKVKSKQIIEEEVIICANDTYTLVDGIVVSEAGIYTVELLDNSTACVVTYITNLGIENAYEATQEISICEGQTYILPNGDEVSEENIYESILQSNQGCDSIIFTNLSVKLTEVIQNSVSICIGHTHTLEDGTVVSAAGPYSVDIINPDGCITTYSTIVNTSETIYPQAVDICEEDTYILPDGIEVNEAGKYRSVLKAVNDCDSIISTQVTVIEKRTIQNPITICAGTSYTLEDGTIVSDLGTYTIDAIHPTTGCLATFVTNLDFVDAFETTMNVYICDNETHFLPDGMEVYTSGVYENILESTQGCDSLIITNLVVKQATPVEKEVSICTGSTFVLEDGTVVTEAGTYNFDFIDYEIKCTVAYSVTVSINDELSSTQEVAICKGQTYLLPDGLEVFESNTYESKISSTQGCDSIITTNLTVSPPLVIIKEVDLCKGTSYTLEDGLEVVDAGIYFAELQDETTACITIHQTNINLVDNVETSENATICEGEVYMLADGTAISLAGVYENVLQSVNGCDSIVSINLTTSLIDISLPVELSFTKGGVEMVSSIQTANEVEYLWSPADGLSCTDCLQPFANPTETTTYLLEVTDVNGGCQANASVTVIPIKGEPLVANAFSPNNDGINDFLIPLNIEAATDFLFVIYNRYGKKLFETKSATQAWDGFYNNEKQPIGVYVWYLQYQLPEADAKQIKGNVTLVR